MAITSYKSLLTGQILIMKKKIRDPLARKKDGYYMGTQPGLPPIASMFHSVLDVS